MRILLAFMVGLVLGDNTVEQRVTMLSRDLRNRYHVWCSVLLFTENDEDRASRIAKHMMTSFEGPVGVSSIGTYLRFHKTEVGDVCPRTFFIILADGVEAPIGYLKQLSEAVKTELEIWLVYLRADVVLAEFFAEVNAAYNMDLLAAQEQPSGEMKLFEVYRVSMDHPLRVVDYGTWSEDTGLITTSSISFYERRRDLEGLTLRVTIKHSPPKYVLVPVWDGQRYYIQGLFGSIWRDIEYRLNFTSIFSMSNESGTILPNKKWNGVIGMILAGESDVGLAEITMSSVRCSVVHCLRPIISTRNNLYFKKTRLRIQWDVILQPFQTETWLTIILWFVSSAVALTICFRIARFYGLETGSSSFNIFNSFISVYSAFCQQGSFMTPESLSCRIVFFMSYSVAAVLFTVYSATLTSFLARKQPFRPFEDLESLLEDGRYSLEVFRNSAIYSSFANASDPFMKRVFQELIAVLPASAQPASEQEAMERICSKGNVVYLGTEYETKKSAIEVSRQGECEVISAGSLNLVFITMLLSKSSKFKEVINNILDELSYYGMMKRLVSKALAETEVKMEKSFVGTDLTQVSQIYATLFFGICTSIAIFIAEKLIFQANQPSKLKKMA